jgi:phenylalanyl-tRNA synthetase beta chain
VKLSFDWLGDYVDLSGLTPQEVADKLTMGAFEVEEVREFGPDIQGEVVVGEIVEINPHPNADKIRVTKTRVREGEEPREIVCGAWNIEVGNRIPVALPGSKVINRKDGTALPIVAGAIRGVTSNGMLCSPPELGVTGNGEGILILDQSTPLGTDIKELLGIKRDSVLIVGTRSNRGDALSVIGLAREVAALFGRPLKEPQWSLPAEIDHENPVTVSVEDTADCPYFSIRVISDLKNTESPPWMVRRLEAVGMRSVSALVDITNYVMHELGQPLHAYDIRQINGRYIETRRARKGEKLVTLDERQRELSDEVLVIADANGVIGIAGVMGGKGSEIADDTTEVALEAASFNFARVRRSSRLLGLSSDSSVRFERGVDIASVHKASDRAAYLMSTICGGKMGAFMDAGSDVVQPLQITLRLSEMVRLTEIETNPGEVTRLLSPLGFEVSADNDSRVSVKVPSYRINDVTREVDLVEEITRLHGYDKVPPSMPKRTIAPPLPDTVIPEIKNSLSASGLSEAWISSLVALADINGRGAVQADDDEIVKVLNPLSEDHQVLRTTLLPGLLKAVGYNQDRGREDVWLFETGLIYKRDPSIAIDRSATGTREYAHVAAIISGDNQMSQWEANRQPTETMYFTLKGVVENTLDRLAVPVAQLQFSAEPDAPGWFHPSRSARIVLKPAARDKSEPIVLGWIGEVHPAVAEAYGLKNSAALFELSVDQIRLAQRPRTFREISTTPAVVRDLTADLSRSVNAGAVQVCITQTAGKLLQQVDLVSTFDLSDEQKSLSYRLVFQDPDKTLTADEVEKVIGKVRQQLTRQLSATFRT